MGKFKLIKVENLSTQHTTPDTIDWSLGRTKINLDRKEKKKKTNTDNRINKGL